MPTQSISRWSSNCVSEKYRYMNTKVINALILDRADLSIKLFFLVLSIKKTASYASQQENDKEGEHDLKRAFYKLLTRSWSRRDEFAGLGSKRI